MEKTADATCSREQAGVSGCERARARAHIINQSVKQPIRFNRVVKEGFWFLRSVMCYGFASRRSAKGGPSLGRHTARPTQA
eukprot:scaffold23306_cov125-Isochrysis_galbana.AAC.15